MAVWDTKYINDLPDAAFAAILPGGKKDETGKTVPRKLRVLPHHTKKVKSAAENSSVDLPHLRNALARVNQLKASPEIKAKAKAHLDRHAKALLKKEAEQLELSAVVEQLPAEVLQGNAAPGWLPPVQELDEDDAIVRRTFAIEERAGSINEEERSVRVVASTDALDSYGEVVEQKWLLKRYRKNPTVLYKHNRPASMFGGMSQAETLPIGYATDIENDGHLEATLHFVDATASPLAEQVWQGFRQRSMRAVSVGFVPHDIRKETHNGKEVYILSKNELFEISAAPIGANHEAVAKSADGRTVHQRNLDQLERLYQRQLAEQQGASAATEITLSDQNGSAVGANHIKIRLGKLNPAESGQESPTETAMDPKELQTKYEALEAEKTQLEGQIEQKDAELVEAAEALKTSQEKVAELEGQVKTKTDELATAQSEIDRLAPRVAELEQKEAEHDVDQWIPKKAAPAEREDLLEDRKRLGAEKFAERMTRRTDLPHTKDVTGADPSRENDVATGASASERVANAAKAEAEKAARS